jgi:hypothetical protein
MVHPAPNGIVRRRDSPFRQQIPNVGIAQGPGFGGFLEIMDFLRGRF